MELFSERWWGQITLTPSLFPVPLPTPPPPLLLLLLLAVAPPGPKGGASPRRRSDHPSCSGAGGAGSSSFELRPQKGNFPPRVHPWGCLSIHPAGGLCSGTASARPSLGLPPAPGDAPAWQRQRFACAPAAAPAAHGAGTLRGSAGPDSSVEDPLRTRSPTGTGNEGGSRGAAAVRSGGLRWVLGAGC